jgi:uncharacterized protein (TIRG00374 family)
MASGPHRPHATSRLWTVGRFVVGVGLAVAVFAVLLGDSSELSGASARLVRLDWRWVVVAGAVEVLSLASFTRVQQVLLGATGVRVRATPLFAITLATNSIANSLPAGPAVAGVFRYRQYRRRGADDVAAGWVVVAGLVAAATGLALFAVGGIASATVAGATFRLAGAVVTIATVLVLAGIVLTQHDLVAWTLRSATRGARRLTGHPRPGFEVRLERVVERLRTVQLGWRRTGVVVGWAVATWAFDCACLAFAFVSVRAPIPWRGLLLAYGLAQLAAALPVTPGGLGLVEGSLAAVLIAYGGLPAPTVAAVLIYRIVSFWLALPVGWASWALIVHRGRRTDREVAEATEQGRVPPSPGGTADGDAPGAAAPGGPGQALTAPPTVSG